ncbi:unnamed protein product [Brassica napus]|uniref:(rape) hypothetical protein n=1 Tax=Brassica napus TaxID=3708 RepID=A0A817BCK3_BRANA|nr:unnamed protein product [Brassica napus]
MELDEDRVHKMGNDEGSGDGFQNLSDGEVEVNSDQVTEGLNLADGDVVNGLPEEKASVVGDVEKKKVVRKGTHIDVGLIMANKEKSQRGEE